MSALRRFRSAVASVRQVPADLALVVALAVLALPATVLLDSSWAMVRVALGVPLVVFAPGYVLVAALFPATDQSLEGEPATPEARRPRFESGIGNFERLVLSVGLSVGISAFVGLILDLTPWGIRFAPTLVALETVTIFTAGVAAVRRSNLPPSKRFRVSFGRWFVSVRTAAFGERGRPEQLLHVALALSVVVATASVAYAVAVPRQSETYTEFYLLSEGPDGELVADDYPTRYARGESKPLVVGVTNREGEVTNYSVVVELQRVAVSNNSSRVLERRTLDRFRTRLGPDETMRRPHAVEPTLTGDRLRLQYLLYRNEPPQNPRQANAYREVHLWINVTAPG